MSMLMSKGERPWLPAWNASDYEVVLEVADTPLVGTLEVDGSTYIYTCLIGDLGRLSVWAYVPATPTDVEFVKSGEFRTPADMRTWVDHKAFRSATQVALSWDDVVQLHADVRYYQTIFDAIDDVLNLFSEPGGVVGFQGRAGTWDGTMPERPEQTVPVEREDLFEELASAHEEARELVRAGTD
jgi:hypothetical protein